MANPHEDGGVSITLKQDGRDGMWTVFHGSPARIRENIIALFGLEGVDELTLHEVSLEAQRIYKGAGNAASILGARPVASKSSEAWKQAQATEAAPAEPERDPLLDKIEAVKDVESLKLLWAENRPAFDENPDLLSQWKLRGKAIAEAAK